VIEELVAKPLEELMNKDTGTAYLFKHRSRDGACATTPGCCLRSLCLSLFLSRCYLLATAVFYVCHVCFGASDLKRLFYLVSHRPGLTLIEKVAPRLREFVRGLGTDIVAKEQKGEAGPKDGEDSHGFVKQLMALHDDYMNIVKECFKEHMLFQKALKEAFEDFINQETTVSKLLAKFVNDALKKGSKINQADLDGTLNNVVKLYGYIREKDVFEREYQLHLSARLLQGTSESDLSEKSMIAKLKVRRMA